jgi:hypothetical protein
LGDFYQVESDGEYVAHWHPGDELVSLEQTPEGGQPPPGQEASQSEWMLVAERSFEYFDRYLGLQWVEAGRTHVVPEHELTRVHPNAWAVSDRHCSGLAPGRSIAEYAAWLERGGVPALSRVTDPIGVGRSIAGREPAVGFQAFPLGPVPAQQSRSAPPLYGSATPAHMVWTSSHAERALDNALFTTGDSSRFEVGGHLLGRLVENGVVVRDVELQRDAERGPHNVRLSTALALSAEAKVRAWNPGTCVELIGDWHAHPTGSGVPSGNDRYAWSVLREALGLPYVLGLIWYRSGDGDWDWTQRAWIVDGRGCWPAIISHEHGVV